MTKYEYLKLCSVVVLALLFSIAGQAEAAVTIDFEAFPFGIQPLDFLAPFGISNITIGGTGPHAGPPTILNPFPHPACSGTHVLAQSWSATDGPSQSHSLTFHFSQPLAQFSLCRAGTLIPANSIPAWSAQFFNASDVLLGSFGEPFTIAQLPVKTFTFTAPPGQTIAKMTLESVWSFATFRNIMVDDFVLVPATPENMISNLIALVTGFNLNPRLQNSLNAKLALAQNALAHACTHIGAFISQTQAQSGRQLTPAEATDLIAAANEVKAVLGCP